MTKILMEFTMLAYVEPELVEAKGEAIHALFCSDPEGDDANCDALVLSSIPQLDEATGKPIKKES